MSPRRKPGPILIRVMGNKQRMTTSTDKLTLYVYYKIPAQQNTLHLLAVQQLQQAVALRYPAVVMQRQKRPGADATNQETWMEVYAGITPRQLEPLLADLSALVEVHGLVRARKNELFIDL